MTATDAQELVAKLFAAFPFPQQQMTAAVYIEQLAKLPSRDWALAAVDDLIQTADRLPTIAAVRESYLAAKERYPLPALPLPEMPEEEIAANMARLKALTATIGTSMDLDERLAVVKP